MGGRGYTSFEGSVRHPNGDEELNLYIQTDTHMYLQGDSTSLFGCLIYIYMCVYMSGV